MVKRDLLEAVVNMLAGAAINFVAVIVLFGARPSYAMLTTAIFFFLSFSRSFIVRRIFRKTE